MSPAQVKSDFVNVRLAEAGRIFAGPNGTVRIANAHMDYKFSGDVAQRVLTSEWTKIFATERCASGMMFELEPATMPVAPVVAQAAIATTLEPDAVRVASAAAAKPVVIESQPEVQNVAVATQEK